MTGNYGQQGRGNVSLFSVISTPIIILVLAAVLLVYNLVGLIGVLVNGGEIVYEQEALDSYMATAYDDNYKKASAPKSGIVLMFFYNEDTNSLDYTYKAGSNVSTYVSGLFATDGKFDKYLEKNLKMDNYKATLGDTFVKAIEETTKELKDLKLMANFVFEHDTKNMPKSQAVVKKGAESAYSTDSLAKVSTALAKFQAETGVYLVMSFDTSVNAFGRTIPTTDIFMVVLLVAVIGLCTFNLVKKIREYNRIKNDFGGQEPTRIRVNARSPYYDEDEDDDAPSTEEADESSEEETDEVEATEEAEEDSDKKTEE